MFGEAMVPKFPSPYPPVRGLLEATTILPLLGMLKAQGVGARLELVPEDLDGKAPAADELLGQLLGVLLYFRLTFGQVDSEESSVPSFQI
jgi:hypothetical protein